MSATVSLRPEMRIKQPHGLSPRVAWLRDYYFTGVARPWNNEFQCFTTGRPWDVVYDEISYYIVPESYAFFQPFRSSALQAATVCRNASGASTRCHLATHQSMLSP